jgi:hypothetical protein
MSSHLTSSSGEGINKNVYSAQPATPMLASSLLPASSFLSQKTIMQHQSLQPSDTQRCSDSQSWNLKVDIEKGIVKPITSCEPPAATSVFRCGIVVGFSWLKRGRRRGGTGCHNEGKRNNNEDENLEECRRRVGEVRLPFFLFSILYLLQEIQKFGK